MTSLVFTITAPNYVLQPSVSGGASIGLPQLHEAYSTLKLS